MFLSKISRSRRFRARCNRAPQYYRQLGPNDQTPPPLLLNLRTDEILLNVIVCARRGGRRVEQRGVS